MVKNVASSGDGNIILSHLDDDRILRWNGMNREARLEPICVHTNKIVGINRNEDGTVIVSPFESEHGCLKLRQWNATTRYVIGEPMDWSGIYLRIIANGRKEQENWDFKMLKLIACVGSCSTIMFGNKAVIRFISGSVAV